MNSVTMSGSEAELCPPAKAHKSEAARAAVPATNPDERRCNYYVTRKHRFCRTERRPGCCFCPTHDVSTDTARPHTDQTG